MRALRILTLGTLAVLLAAAPALAATQSFTATMTAAEEVPDKGPEGATGTGKFDINTDTNQVCYELTMSGVSEPASAAHIHEGAKGVAGGIAIDFKVPENGMKNCVTGDPAKVAAIVANPANFYANIHTASYPKGAVRGQLAAAGGATQTQPQATSLPRTGALTALLAALGLALAAAGSAAGVAGRRR
jgi:hypothetical protein